MSVGIDYFHFLRYPQARHFSSYLVVKYQPFIYIYSCILIWIELCRLDQPFQHMVAPLVNKKRFGYILLSAQSSYMIHYILLCNNIRILLTFWHVFYNLVAFYDEHSKLQLCVDFFFTYYSTALHIEYTTQAVRRSENREGGHLVIWWAWSEPDLTPWLR